MSVSHPHPFACVATHEAPLIGERATNVGAAERKVAMSAPA